MIIAVAISISVFTFTVFADTAISPTQVMSYADTTGNLKIYGTAQRLQYNVDSIQVILTNPPDNYGSACTPILVSFRFANTGTLPAYISTPQFEITATNSTGTINTMVYGYDPISTDLFISNYNYDSQNVGRITIVPAQQFSYYSGFVVPPNESIYFSAIVYVNASAFETSNTPTGSTEQVNQIVMSALNFYSGQISYSSDYPYSGMPIDFSDLISAIEDLSSTVSTSSEMQDLINVVSYTGGNYVPVLNTASFYDTTYITNSNVSDLQTRIFRIISNEYYLNNDIEINCTDDTIMSTGTKVRYANYRLILVNNNSQQYIRFNEFLAINEVLPSGSISYEIINVDSQDFSSLGFQELNNTATGRRISFSFINAVNGYGYIGPNQRAELNFTIKLYYRDTVTPTFNNPSIRISQTPSLVSDVYAPRNIYTIIRDLYLSYISVNTGNVSSQSTSVESQSNANHQLEESYYTANSNAINATGLSNYRFDNTQSNGIGAVSNDFTSLWNALGSFNSIYIFSMTLSVALMIFRHVPGVVKGQFRVKVKKDGVE